MYPNIDSQLQNEFKKYIQRIKKHTRITNNGYVAENKLKDIFGIS
jgi:hypothetical protein